MVSKKATTAANDDLIHRNTQNKRRFLLGDVDFLFPSDSKNRADENMSTNTVYVRIIEETDEMSSLDVGPDSTIYELNEEN